MTKPEHSTDDAPRSHRAVRAPWIPGMLLVAVLALLYRSSLHSPFFFDDIPAVLENPNIESLTPLSRALDAENGNGADRRPLVALSLALNYAAGERSPYGYHVVNLGLHILAALALFGLVRQTLLLGSQGPDGAKVEDPEARANGIGFALALVWSVHPLHTSTLHMVINRNELMVGLFAFLTLYGAIRSFRASRRAPWILVSILACLLGAASKEVIASLPLVVLLFDRTFHSPTLRAALAGSRVLYSGLALSWGALAFLATTGSRGESAGFGLPGFGPLDYLMSQTGALLHYLKLTFWPATLAFDYSGWPVPESLADCWPQGLIVLALLTCTWIAWRRGSIAGLLGLSSFLILSPSSSFIPLSGALVAEHRMYIPVAALLGATACLLGRPLARLAPARATMIGFALALLGAGVLATRTYTRNGDFESERILWGATVDVRPDNGRAWNSYGMALRAEGLVPAARNAYERALAIDPRHYRALVNLGNIHFDAHEWELARPLYTRALERSGSESDPHYYLGVIAVNRGEYRDGVQHLRRALEGELSRPLRSPTRQSLAWTLATAPAADVRDGKAALEFARALDESTAGRNPRVLDALAAALAETGEFDAAATTAERAARIARSRGQGPLADQIERRQRSYASGSPWRSER